MAQLKIQQEPSCVPSLNAKHYTAFCTPNIKVMFVSQATSISQNEHVKRQATYLKGNKKGLSRNHCCRGKAIRITHSGVCL